MSARRRSWWGWGFEDAVIDPEPLRGMVEATLGFPPVRDAARRPPDPAGLELPAPRVALPAFVSADSRERLAHARGKSTLDVLRALDGDVADVPDGVAFAHSAEDVERVLEWAAGEAVAVIPYGGGTSVCAGVEPRVGPAFAGTVSLDLGGLDRVLEVDPVSRAARIEGGATGPGLEAQLAEHGLTMRFFPQSFELSTLGGWIATRAGGHFATVWTHVDDLVESVSAVTPGGTWTSRRLPGSGAGPSPDRMLLGSEGILGVITDAWVRVQPKPRFRAARAVRFASGFVRAAECVRELSQSGLHPSNVRLLDAEEARWTGAGDGSHAVLVLGFESTDHEVDAWMARALAIAREHGGESDDARPSAGGAVDTWREAFIAMPYVRDALLRLHVLVDTFETAITWERFPAFHEAIVGAVREALGEPSLVSCRFTHVYPDGPAPYYTVMAPARRGEEVAQWRAMKEAAGDAIIAAGGTITHHHAVGRDHRPWYDRQRPEPFAVALRAAKAALDPAGILNPGVLID